MPPPSIVTVQDGSQIFEARRTAASLAQGLGWDETQAGKLAIAASEAASNFVKHANGGELHFRYCERGGVIGIELLALDRGPGLADSAAALRDGFSTTGTAGTGLGAIRRLSAEFDIHSQPGKGTALVARFYPSQAARLPDSTEFTVGVVQVPMRGEPVCGDSWGVRRDGEKTIVLLADGLGHGVGAAQASQEAVAVLERAAELDPVTLVNLIHSALRSTRGAAIAIAGIDRAKEQLDFAGVGNISALILGGGSTQHLVSHNGTAGQAVRKVQAFSYPWPATGTLIMHSDGLTTSWRLDSYPGLLARHPSLIAGVLYRDASRGRDDVCVMVARL